MSSTTRRLRLKSLDPTELPSHPALQSLQSSTRSSTPDLSSFIRDVLSEGLHFADSVLPTSFKDRGSPKASPPSAAKVQISAADIRGDTWFARQSVHENAPLDGTASYDEFEEGLFHYHSDHEMEYTPTVYDAHKVLDWSEQIAGIEEGFGEQFEEVEMEIFEMTHHIPSPLQNRTFSTLVTRAITREGSFLVVQIPVDITKIPEALYANGRNVKDGETSQKKQKVTVGAYTSIERVKEQADGQIMWEMATTSDAKGMLPMSVQKMGIPGAVVKDVGFFIQWAQDRRKETGGEGAVDSSAGKDRPPNDDAGSVGPAGGDDGGNGGSADD